MLVIARLLAHWSMTCLSPVPTVGRREMCINEKKIKIKTIKHKQRTIILEQLTIHPCPFRNLRSPFFPNSFGKQVGGQN